MSYSISENFKRAVSNATESRTVHRMADHAVWIGTLAGTAVGLAGGVVLAVPHFLQITDTRQVVIAFGLSGGGTIAGAMAGLVAGSALGIVGGLIVKAGAIIVNTAAYDALPPKRLQPNASDLHPG